MADGTKIDWATASWNPIRARESVPIHSGKPGWHCEHVSEGCRNCYAEAINKRLGTGLGYTAPNGNIVDVYLDEAMLAQPLRWKKPRRIFLGSMTDVFGRWVPDEWLDRLFAVMALCPQHRFIILTKRTTRMIKYLKPYCSRRADALGGLVIKLGYKDPLEGLPWPLPNVILGTSVEDEVTARERLLDLKIVAFTGWHTVVSIEPLLAALDLRNIETGDYIYDLLRPMTSREVWDDCWSPEATGVPLDEAIEAYTEEGGTYPPTDKRPPGIGWVITGGESGTEARPCHPDWIRKLRDDCAATGVPFFFKQWGAWTPGENVKSRRTLDTAHWFDERWIFGRESWADSEGRHIDDEPDLYRVGKKAAGHHLDGVAHREIPAFARLPGEGR